MADLAEIVEELRAIRGNGLGHEEERDSVPRGSTKRKRSRKYRNFGRSQDSARPSQPDQIHEETREENEGDGPNIRQQGDGQKQEILPIQEDHEALFYAEYHEVAEEYDKEFLKKYDEDLNTTLIFAGLFSAVTSAFIIQVDSQLKPDPSDETVALLRLLIYKIDSTTFGDNVPTLPIWTGPPPMMIHVQAILFASLSISLLSALLAMLGKQWLNRYVSTDMRGSAIERSQHRQQKLDGIVAWYFDHVMESLPLMLQAALLLLGCALSRYLWNVTIIVASVVIAVTSLGIIFYLSIIVAGALSESCPYQTPGSHILRHLGPKVWGTIRSVGLAINPLLRNAFGHSFIIGAVVGNAVTYDPWWSRNQILTFLGHLILGIPVGFAIDAYRLGRAAIRGLSALPAGASHLVRCANDRLYGIYSTLQQRLAQQPTPSHLRCISWTLQTSLDKPVHLITLKYLLTMKALAGLDPTLVTDCFNVFVGCVSLSDRKLVIIQGLEQLAIVSAGCLFRTFCHLSVTDPTSSILADFRRRYIRIFPFGTDFNGLPFYHTITATHILVNRCRNPSEFLWDDYRASAQEYIIFAQHTVEAARVEYRRTEGKKVPRWILHFAMHSLSLDSPPPTSVIADCLTIVAIDLGCDVSNIMASENSARVELVSTIINRELERVASTSDSGSILSKCKAIAALFPYAVRQEQDVQRPMADAILRVWASNPLSFVWRRIEPHVIRLLGKSVTPSLYRAIPHIFPQIIWSADQDAVDLLLQIAYIDSLLPHIPIDMWAWLKKRPSLPPECRGRRGGTTQRIVRRVRGVGDVDTLKSYFLVVWSEWDDLYNYGLKEMEISIREDFGGIEMKRHRKDLLDRLDHVLEQLEDSHHDEVQYKKGQYGRLKEVLLQVDGEQ